MANRYSMATGTTGVTLRLSSNRYVAHIFLEGKERTKTFDTFEEAVAQRKAWEEYKDKVKPKANKTANEANAHKLCTEYCRDCKFSQHLDHTGTALCCMYYLMIGERRPCYAGDGCTVKELKTTDHNDRLRKYYNDSFFYTDNESKWEMVRVDKALNKLK